MCKYCDADIVDRHKAKSILGVVNHYLRHGDYPHLDRSEFSVVSQALLAFITNRPELLERLDAASHDGSKEK